MNCRWLRVRVRKTSGFEARSTIMDKWKQLPVEEKNHIVAKLPIQAG